MEMGCIGSHVTRVLDSARSRTSRSNPNSNSRHNSFQVFNVDDLGRHQVPGKLEVTESDLVLRIPGKAPLTWPLRSLRRYGYEHDLFSFESGRRCPTGAGIYAFKCNRAQVIFNLLQAKIQEGNLSVPLPPPAPPPSTLSPNDPPTPSSTSPAFDYVNISEHPNQSRPLHPHPHQQHDEDTSGTESPLSPLDPHFHPLLRHPLYMNVESQKKLQAQGRVEEGEELILHPKQQETPNYQNHHPLKGHSKVKVNGHRSLVLDGPTASVPLLYQNDLNFNRKGGERESEGGSIHYTNVECRRRSSMTTPTRTTPEVNYAELDLEQSAKRNVTVTVSELSPEDKVTRVTGREWMKPTLESSKSLPFPKSPSEEEGEGSGSGGNGGREELGYATIDFDRTAALSGVTRTKIKLDFHSASMDRDEDGLTLGQGSSPLSALSARTKLRHNSTAL